MLNQRLREKMQLMRDLKAEHCIGSQDAFECLKAVERNQRVCDDLSNDSSLSTQLTHRDVSMLQSDIVRLANYWLALMVVAKSTVEKFWVVPENAHCVLHPVEKAQGQPAKHLWSINLSLMLVLVLRQEQKLPSTEVLTRKTFGFFPGAKVFAPLGTTEWLSGSEIVQDLGFLPPPDSSLKEMMQWVLSGVADNLQLEAAELKIAKQANDWDRCRQICCRINQNGIYEDLRLWQRRSSRGGIGKFKLTEEESHYLFSADKLKRRASLELTLGRLEIERKIAIGIIYNAMEIWPGLTIPELIEARIEEYRRIMQNTTERLSRWVANNNEFFVKEFRKLLREVRYMYLAVYQNRRWLKKFFSN